LQNVIVPGKRAAAKEAAAVTQETVATGFDQKQVAALTAVGTCAHAESPTAQQASDARTALRELNTAARAANKPEFASQECIDRISITATSVNIKTACDAAFSKLAAAERCEK